MGMNASASGSPRKLSKEASTSLTSDLLPKSCLNLPFLPTPLVFQSADLRLAVLAVRTTMCCMSLHVNSVLASRAKAQMAAARGADADVPVCPLVHW